MNRTRTVTALIALALFTPSIRRVRGDGGTLRLSERSGNYQVTAFTSPAPLRAGTVDVSVMVQDPATGRVLPDARVTVRVAPIGRQGEPRQYAATRAAATNKLLKAAVFDLPSPGAWRVELLIDGSLGQTQTGFEMRAAGALPHWFQMGFWISLPAAAVVLFSVHEFLVERAAARRRRKRGSHVAIDGHRESR